MILEKEIVALRRALISHGQIVEMNHALKVQLEKEMDESRSIVIILKELSEVRTYNSCNVYKGVMVRDNEKTHELIMRAREYFKNKENEK